MKPCRALRAILLFAAFVGAQGSAFDAGAQVRQRDTNREPAREREPREPRERSFPERDFPEPTPAREVQPQPPIDWTRQGRPQAPLRDPALARCDSLRSELESVIRREMQGGDAATMEGLRAKRQLIHQEQRQAGC